MNDSLKQFSADLLKDFKAALLKNQTEALISKIKATDGGTFKVVISTSDEDRQGDMLDQSKWFLDNYEKNPVVLWAHDYGSLPIAICTGISVQGGKLIAEGKFAPAELNPFAAQVAGLYDMGFLTATSVGYIQHEDGDLELLEFSFVPVPANPYALSLRDVKRLNLNTAELVMKGIRLKVKAEQVGDHCELDDGTPGVLSEDEDNPGEMVCVPAGGDKSAKPMKNKLTENLKAEHDRHGEAVAEHIDKCTDKCMKAETPEHEKAIEEFEKAMDGEMDTHLEKCMKAIDDHYELQDQHDGKSAGKKSIEEFKAAFKSEHMEHVKCFDKAIEEFKGEFKPEDAEDDKKKAIEEFETKSGDELTRHEKAHVEMCAEMGEGEEDGKAAADIETKSGRQISAANKEKIKAVIKAVQDFHEAHTSEHEKHTNDVIAALKALMGPDEGNDGEEPKPKAAEAPKPRSRSAGAAINLEVTDVAEMTPFQAFMFNRDLLRTVNSTTGKALEAWNKKFRENFPNRR
jgi:hypothetical protein